MSIVSRFIHDVTHPHSSGPVFPNPLDPFNITDTIKNEITAAVGHDVKHEDLMNAANYADGKAKEYNEEHAENGSFCDCVTVVAAACAAAGAIVGGVAAGAPTAGTGAIAGAAAGAALGASGGYPMGRLVCERYYDRTPCN